MSGGAKRLHSSLGFWFVLAISYVAIYFQGIHRLAKDVKFCDVYFFKTNPKINKIAPIAKQAISP
jgi:hypothetical protein